MITISVLIVLFVSGDSPYFCPILFIFLLYQDPFLSVKPRFINCYKSSRIKRDLLVTISRCWLLCTTFVHLLERLIIAISLHLGWRLNFFLICDLTCLFIMKLSDVIVGYIIYVLAKFYVDWRMIVYEMPFPDIWYFLILGV